MNCAKKGVLGLEESCGKKWGFLREERQKINSSLEEEERWTELRIQKNKGVPTGKEATQKS